MQHVEFGQDFFSNINWTGAVRSTGMRQPKGTNLWEVAAGNRVFWGMIFSGKNCSDFGGFFGWLGGFGGTRNHNKERCVFFFMFRVPFNTHLRGSIGSKKKVGKTDRTQERKGTSPKTNGWNLKSPSCKRKII